MGPSCDRNDMCSVIEQYAKRKGFDRIRCFVVTLDCGAKEYAICDDKEWLYGSSNSEAVAAHIDMMKINRR